MNRTVQILDPAKIIYGDILRMLFGVEIEWLSSRYRNLYDVICRLLYLYDGPKCFCIMDKCKLTLMNSIYPIHTLVG